MAPKLNQGNYAIVRTDVVIGGIQKKESEAERSDSFSIGLCGKRLTGSAEFGILEKIMGFFSKRKEQRNSEEKEKNERKRARNDFEKKLGLHVGDSFQDT